MASNSSLLRALFVAALMSSSLSAIAQDIVLNVSTTVGANKPQVSEHKVTAGTEVAVYTGALYRVMVKPTLKSATSVELSFKVLDATSGAPVAAPTIRAYDGKVATYTYGRCSASREDCVAQGLDGMDASKKLQLDVTPSL